MASSDEQRRGTDGAADRGGLTVTGAHRGWLLPLLRLDRLLSYGDNGAIVIMMTTSVTLAALSVLLDNFSLPSSPWLDVVPRYCNLGIGFIGAAVATRKGSHIALDLSNRFLPPAIARWTRFAADSVACVVSALLALGSWEFIGFEREAGGEILYVLPQWVPAIVLLWGFAFSALRFLLRAAQTHAGALVLLPGILLLMPAMTEDAVIWLGAVGLGVGILLGTPLFVVLGGGAMLLFYQANLDFMTIEERLASVPTDIYRLRDAPAMVTLPLFTFMGGILAASGAPQRLVRIARAWLGWAPGGLAVAAVLISAFFTTFTGASGVTILAMGLLLHTLLTQEGYPDRQSIGLITASGSIGLLFAPALPLIIYAIVAKVDINHMFRAGIGPGIVLIIFVSTLAVIRARGANLQRHAFHRQEAWQALKGGIWELLLPAIILGLFLTGRASVVGASAIGVVYVVLVAVFVHKDIHFRRDLPLIARDSGVLIGAVLVILGVAIAFTGYLVDEQVPQMVIQWAKDNIESRWVFLLSLNVLLLVVGCLLDIFSAIIIFVPLIAPVAVAFGVNPVHLGIIFLANLEIGYLTPPVGMNLFLSAFRFKKDLPEIWRASAPYLFVLLAALMVITYWPGLSLWLVPEP